MLYCIPSLDHPFVPDVELNADHVHLSYLHHLRSNSATSSSIYAIHGLAVAVLLLIHTRCYFLQYGDAEGCHSAAGRLYAADWRLQYTVDQIPSQNQIH